MQTINIKWKEYVTVAERIKFLSEKIKEYSINTSYDYFPERKMWVVKAILTIGEKSYSWLAQEIETTDEKKVNFASALENAETSAIGRACAMAWIGIINWIASADEINKASNRSWSSNYQQKNTATTSKQSIVDSVAEEVLNWGSEDPNKASDKQVGFIYKLFERLWYAQPNEMYLAKVWKSKIEDMDKTEASAIIWELSSWKISNYKDFTSDTTYSYDNEDLPF